MGILLSFENITKYESLADKCETLNRQGNNKIDLECTCDDENHSAEDTFSADFINNNIYNDVPKITPILFTGYSKIVPENIKGTTYSKKSIVLYNTGASDFNNIVEDKLDYFTHEEMLLRRTYLHEISHTLGAVDSYCKGENDTGFCSNQNCVKCRPDDEATSEIENPYEENCIMAHLSPKSNQPTASGDTMHTISTGEWLCEQCKKDIYNYLN